MAKKANNQGAVTSWDALRQCAKQGYSDGIVVLGTIATIEHGNHPNVIEAIQDADTDLAAVMLRDAAFFRVQMLVVRAFDPVNSGDDLHLRAAVNFLREPGRISEADPARQADLQKTVSLFDAADADPCLPILKHMRNKELAHWAEYGDAVARPRIKDLFGFARQTALVWERLSYGAGTCMVDIDHQIDAYREAADAFWSRWD